MYRRLFQKRVSLILSLVLLLLFILFSAWWYGLFSDVGKHYEFFHFAKDVDPQKYAYDEDYVIEFAEERQKLYSTLSTAALIDILAYWADIMDHVTYSYPNTAYAEFLYQMSGWLDGPFHVLSNRNNAGKELLKAYQTCPAFEFNRDGNIHSNKNKLAFLELLLSRPKFQSHLTPEDKEELDSLIQEKQWEKFSSWHSPYFLEKDAYYNYLYLDAYNEVANTNLDYEKNNWNENRLKEYAEPYEHLLVEKQKNYFSKSFQQKILNEIRENTQPRWKRFDNCQITQP